MIGSATGILTAGLGILALIGWAIDSPVLASLGVDRIPMAPSTAVLLIVYGVAFTLRRTTTDRAVSAGTISRALIVLGSISVLLILLTSTALGVLLPIENLGMTLTAVAPKVRAVGHMSSITALCFLLAGAAFLLDGSGCGGRKTCRHFARFCRLILYAVSFAFLMGYLLGAPLLYSKNYIPPALSTLLAFGALGLSLESSARRLTRSISRKKRYLLIPIFAVSVVGIVGTGYLNYHEQESRFRTEIENRLAAIAESKTSELLLFRDERKRDASGFMDNLLFSRLLRRCLSDPSDTEALSLLQNWIAPYLKGDRYVGVYVLDERGNTRISLPFDPDPRAGISELLAAEISAAGEPAFQDFYLDAREDRAMLSLIVPVSDPEFDRRPLGLLVFRIDPSVYLFPSLKSWAVPSRTGETLLVRREGKAALFLNDLRFHDKAALRLRVPLDLTDRAAAAAALGREGSFEGLDYRDETVISSIRSVPGSPWYVIAKMDSEEAFKPLRERMWLIIVLVTGFIAAGAAGIHVLQRNRELDFYRDKLKSLNDLKRTTAFMESLYDNANAPIVVWDTNFKIVRVNPALAALTGRTPAELSGGPLEPLFPPEEAALSIGKIRTTSFGESLENAEIRIAARDGSARAVLWNSVPVYEPDGRSLIATIAQGHDVTDIKEAELRLHERLAELRRWQELMLGREERVMELKREVNGLLAERGLPARYGEGSADGN